MALLAKDVVFASFLLTMMAWMGQAKILDISAYKDMITRYHNEERSKVRPQASNMKKVVWDYNLEAKAEQWASQCMYQRPPHEWRVGSNLYYHRDAVHGHVADQRIVQSSLDAWSRQKTYFTYSNNCGSACHYVQMIHTGCQRVGCAMSSCNQLMTRRHGGEKATLMVCIYSPHMNLRNSFPYEQGIPCSRCSSGQDCLGCSQGVAVKLPDPFRRPDYTAPLTVRRPPVYPERRPRPYQPEKPPRFVRPSRQLVADAMTKTEEREVLDAHNDARIKEGMQTLVWDNYLERWTNHVINCSVDYPGPSYMYSNFHRFDSNDRLTGAMYEWKSRASVKPPRVDHKCRTPEDRTPCSHWSNAMQPQITSMACATKACEGYTRQMVCIYDNRTDRDTRLSELRRERQPDRSHHRNHNRYDPRRSRYPQRYVDPRRRRGRDFNKRSAEHY